MGVRKKSQMTVGLEPGVSVRVTRTTPQQRREKSLRSQKQVLEKAARIRQLEDLVAKLATNRVKNTNSTENQMFSQLTQARVEADNIGPLRGQLVQLSNRINGLKTSRLAFANNLRSRLAIWKRDLLRSARALAESKRTALRTKNMTMLASIEQRRADLSLQRDAMSGQFEKEATDFKSSMIAQKTTLLQQFADTQAALQKATNAQQLAKRISR
jgi:hypothetical protein